MGPNLERPQIESVALVQSESDVNPPSVEEVSVPEVLLVEGQEISIDYRSSFFKIRPTNKPYIGTRIIGKTR